MQIISLSRLSLKVKSEIKSLAFRGHLRKAGHALYTRGDEHIFSPFIFTTIAGKFKSLHERRRFFAVNNPPFKETPVVGPFHYNAREREEEEGFTAFLGSGPGGHCMCVRECVLRIFCL